VFDTPLLIDIPGLSVLPVAVGKSAPADKPGLLDKQVAADKVGLPALSMRVGKPEPADKSETVETPRRHDMLSMVGVRSLHPRRVYKQVLLIQYLVAAGIAGRARNILSLDNLHKYYRCSFNNKFLFFASLTYFYPYSIYRYFSVPL